MGCESKDIDWDAEPQRCRKCGGTMFGVASKRKVKQGRLKTG